MNDKLERYAYPFPEIADAGLLSAEEISQSDRDRVINAIVDQGMPHRARLVDIVFDAMRSLTWRNIFFGVWDCVALGLIISAMVWVPLFGYVISFNHELLTNREQMLFIPVFFASPLLYELIQLLVACKERSMGTLDLLRVYRWSFRQIAAVRMLVFGALSVVVCTAFSCMVGMAGINVSALTVLGISCSALFLFALAQLMVDAHVRWPWSAAVMPVIWVAVNACLVLARRAVEPWMKGLPPLVCLSIGLASAAIYLVSLRRYCAPVRVVPGHSAPIPYAA